MLRRQSQTPTDTDNIKVQQLRNALQPLLVQLIERQALAGISSLPGTRPRQPDVWLNDWDEVANTTTGSSEASAGTSCTVASQTTVEDDSLSQTLECQILYLPSNGNVNPNPADVELTLRKHQAQSHIRQLRELIADKSFQYSHIIRLAPKKSIKTKGRATVKDLNAQISFHCHVYTYCRSRLLILGADQPTLQQFPELKKEDIRASTAMLAPNLPGSTTLRLSWIWNDVTSHILAGPAEDSPVNSATMLECTM